MKFADVLFPPKPVQQPIPIWVGGESGPALRRTAHYGDAWYPIGTNPQFPMDTLTRFKAGVAKLRDLTEKAGRDPAGGGAELPRVVQSGGAAERHGGWRAQAVHRRRGRLDRRHPRLAGGRRYRFRLRPVRSDLAATIDNMRRFRDEVAAKVR